MAVIGTKDVADRLNVSIRRVQAMIKSGLLPAQKIGRDWLVEEADVERLRQQERKPGRPPKRG